MSATLTSEAMKVFHQNDGKVTTAYYSWMSNFGFQGQLAVALFRAQKRSAAAKTYRGGRFKRAAYDVKNWSLAEICRILSNEPAGLHSWGWKRDPATPGYEWVLYVDLPQGQVSFHSASRLQGTDYHGDWDGVHKSCERILAFCDAVSGE